MLYGLDKHIAAACLIVLNTEKKPADTLKIYKTETLSNLY